MGSPGTKQKTMQLALPDPWRRRVGPWPGPRPQPKPPKDASDCDCRCRPVRCCRYGKAARKLDYFLGSVGLARVRKQDDEDRQCATGLDRVEASSNGADQQAHPSLIDLARARRDLHAGRRCICGTQVCTVVVAVSAVIA